MNEQMRPCVTTGALRTARCFVCSNVRQSVAIIDAASDAGLEVLCVECFRRPFTDAPIAKDAFRRGAEAMRAQVLNWLVRAQAEATVIVVDTAIRGVDKLPIPEER